MHDYDIYLQSRYAHRSRFAESKYRNLCAACERPASCYNTDRYYGREGALMCLTDGMGDVAWVRLGDARVHFKVIGKLVYDQFNSGVPKTTRRTRGRTDRALSRKIVMELRHDSRQNLSGIDFVRYKSRR